MSSIASLPPAFTYQPKLVASVLQFLPTEQVDETVKIFSTSTYMRDQHMSAYHHMLADRLDQLPTSSLIRFLWNAQKRRKIPQSDQLIRTIQLAHQFFPDNSTLDFDFFDIETLSKKPTWENSFHSLLVHADTDHLNFLLKFHQFSGQFLDEEFVYSFLNQTGCMNIIVKSQQFQKIPIETIAKVYLIALCISDNGTSKELYDTGRVPGNFYELVPNDIIEKAVTTFSPGFIPTDLYQ